MASPTARGRAATARGAERATTARGAEAVRRVALVLPRSTYRATDFLDAARGLGVDVVVASDHRPTLADVMGDRAVHLDLRDPAGAARAIASAAARLPLDAVVGVDDAGVETAALASEQLGLPANPPQATTTSRDKAAFRARLADAGIAQPAFRALRDLDEVEAAVAHVGLPCVLKPTRLSASRGVLRADDGPAAREAAAWAQRIGRAAGAGGELLVERFVPGTEVAVEGLVRAGELTVLALFDKPDPLDGPTFEETYYVTPSRLPADVRERATATAQQAVSALGLVEGPVHAELRLPPGGPPVLLEVAARTIGGLCGRALRFGLGMSLEEVVLRHAVGLPLHALARTDAAAGVLMVPVPADGQLTAFDGVAAAERVPGITEVTRTVPLGGLVRRLPEGDRYLGFVVARGRSPGDVEHALRAAHACLDVRVEAADEASHDQTRATVRGAPACVSP